MPDRYMYERFGISREARVPDPHNSVVKGQIMSKFTVTINTDNAAFEGDNLETEVARILRNVADRFEQGSLVGTTRDINGNTVGHFEHLDDENL